MIKRVVVTCLVTLVLANVSLKAQQTSIVSGSVLRAAIANHAAQDQKNREAVLQLLNRSEAREVAQRLGVDLKLAEAAVATLSSEELARVSGQIADADQQLAGGALTQKQYLMLIGAAAAVVILLLLLGGEDGHAVAV